MKFTRKWIFSMLLIKLKYYRTKHGKKLRVAILLICYSEQCLTRAPKTLVSFKNFIFITNFLFQVLTRGLGVYILHSWWLHESWKWNNNYVSIKSYQRSKSLSSSKFRLVDVQQRFQLLMTVVFVKMKSFVVIGIIPYYKSQFKVFNSDYQQPWCHVFILLSMNFLPFFWG